MAKFLIVGGSNTLLDFGLYLGITRAFHPEWILVIKALTFSLASISSFFLNHYWTFSRQRKPKLAEAISFYSVVIVASIINVTATSLYLRVFHHQDIPAVIATAATTVTWNFTLSKYWVFRDGSVVQ